jgi:hypothetical protein
MTFVKKYLVFALVIAVGYFPLISMGVVGPKQKIVSTENRLRASMPEINMRKPVESFKAFQEYFNNNYGLRDMLIMPCSSGYKNLNFYCSLD